ncbi:hypothetical protein BDP27DRAFT_1429410 [Rhodocollybia butyracea]|uniref:Uncharacterized protein n=1 Tax=Rhodocollybia butyracea TaxID=206335 RepID=A0A9P5PCT9_9AGAR|nr:hypothetical protein BDP27DRAFT_1429410 [Rhodocollybia butyracea]
MPTPPLAPCTDNNNHDMAHKVTSPAPRKEKWKLETLPALKHGDRIGLTFGITGAAKKAASESKSKSPSKSPKELTNAALLAESSFDFLNLDLGYGKPSDQMFIFVLEPRSHIRDSKLPWVGYRGGFGRHSACSIYQLKSKVTNIKGLPQLRWETKEKPSDEDMFTHPPKDSSDRMLITPHIRLFGLVFIAVLISAVHAMPTPPPRVPLPSAPQVPPSVPQQGSTPELWFSRFQVIVFDSTWDLNNLPDLGKGDRKAVTNRLTDFCARVSAGSTHKNACPPNTKYRQLCRYLNADASKDVKDEGGEDSEDEGGGGGEVSLSNQMRIFVAQAEEGICSGELPCLKPEVTDINKLPPKLTKDAGTATKDTTRTMKQYEDKFEALQVEKLKDPVWWVNLKTSINIEQLDEKCHARERQIKRKSRSKLGPEWTKKAKMTDTEKAEDAAKKKAEKAAAQKEKDAQKEAQKEAARKGREAQKEAARKEKEAQKEAARKEKQAQKQAARKDREAQKAAEKREKAERKAAASLRPLQRAPRRMCDLCHRGGL